MSQINAQHSSNINAGKVHQPYGFQQQDVAAGHERVPTHFRTQPAGPTDNPTTNPTAHDRPWLEPTRDVGTVGSNTDAVSGSLSNSLGTDPSQKMYGMWSDITH